MNSEQLDPAPQRAIVRCNICRGTMQQGLFRCPHCGQITTGDEKVISEFNLTLQMKARSAERKVRLHCKTCGKQITKGRFCSECEGKNRRNTFLLVIFGIVTLIFLILSFIG